MTMHRAWARALALLATAPVAAAAQAPRTTILAAAGGGRAFAVSSLPRAYDALVGTLGVRHRVWRAMTVEGAVQLQQGWAQGADAVFVCGPVPGDPERCRTNELGSRTRNAQGFASALARVGVERRLGARGPFVRVATGGGYMTEVREPFATLAGGVALGGRRARVALDVDRWWSRVDVTEVTTSLRRPADRSERPYRDGATSTFVRLGLELPVGAGR
jgi:hypothetical protein